MFHQSISIPHRFTAAPAEAPVKSASPMLGLLVALPLGLAMWAGLIELAYLLA